MKCRSFWMIAPLAAISLSCHAQGFMLQSPDILAGATIPARFELDSFGCSGENKSPALRWSNAPKGTQAFAVTVYDPDAPTGSGWWHWVTVNIPANVHELASNAGAAGNANLPQGASQVRNDYGTASWGGLCPPPGDKPHRYVFTVYALKQKLDLPADATAALTGFMIHGNSLGKASFTARYGRPSSH